MAAILPHHRSATLEPGRATTLGAVPAIGPRPAARRAEPTLARRLWWLAVAIGTGWLASSLVATIAAIIGLGTTAASAPLAVGVTAVIAVLLFVRFRAIGRVDEAVVITVIVAAVGTLGLLSL